MNTPQTGSLTKTDRIEGAIDKDTTSELSLGKGGALSYANLSQIMEVAKVVAIAKCAIPAHLRDNVGACLAVCIQASEWQMSPFAVANKSYVVNDRMAYEAQLLAAVILMRAPIKDAFIDYQYSGEGQTRVCTCVCTLESGREVKHASPEFAKILVKNSPLWKSDPDQQLGYYTVRALARRYFPHVILGVYTPEELASETTTEREVGPSFTSEPAAPGAAAGSAAPATPALPPGKPQPEPAAPKPEPKKKAKAEPAAPKAEPTPAPAPSGNGEAGAPTGAAAGTTTQTAPPTGMTEAPADADHATLLADLNKRMDKDGISAKTVREWAAKENLVASSAILTRDYPIDALQAIDERWDEITGN